MDEKETSMYAYKCLIDILAEMVTDYIVDHDDMEEKKVLSEADFQS